MSKSFYLTTTLPYINAPLHMGHALEFVRADTIARWKKMLGYDIYFNTGTDEHGLKIYEKAMEAGVSPQEFVDRGFATFKEQLKMFNIVDDVHFIRTTDSDHCVAAREFWKRVADNGYIYKKLYHAKYCTGCESEKTDSELISGKCSMHPGVELKLISEENYFFRYSAFSERLYKLYRGVSDFVVPEFRLVEMKKLVSDGLIDFSISRLKEKMPWGIPVPGDDTQVMYVWFDALINYISTLGWPDGENFKKYWVHGTPTQYCGKDNTKFQSAMWQAMLMAAGIENSRQIIVNGFIVGEGGIRMSKTLGNVTDPRDIVKTYGTDALRYFLLRHVSNFDDSQFTPERFHEAYTSGLVNGLGNLVSRILSLVEKYGVRVPSSDRSTVADDYASCLDSFDLSKAAEIVWNRISMLDQKIQETAPFKVIKSDPLAGSLLICEATCDLYCIAEMLVPMLPETAQLIKHYIALGRKPETPLFPRI